MTRDAVTRYCDLCDEPLKGHCVFFSDLGAFGDVWVCECCLRKALIEAFKKWDEEADKKAKEDDYDPWLEAEIEQEKKDPKN